MTVLTGGLSLTPSAEARYSLIYPAGDHQREPQVRARFVSKRRFERFIDCSPTAPLVPRNFSRYRQVDMEVSNGSEVVPLSGDLPGRKAEHWARRLDVPVEELPDEVRVQRIDMHFSSSRREGAYVFEVDCGDQPVGSFEGAETRPFVDYVFVYNRERTQFPSPGVEDLAELLRDAVNLSVKNGFIWFVHPIFFVEQYLNVELDSETKREIAYCKDSPEDLPADDERLLGLIFGRQLSGMRRICLDLEAPDECLRTENLAVQVDSPVDLARLVKEVNR